MSSSISLLRVRRSGAHLTSSASRLGAGSGEVDDGAPGAVVSISVPCLALRNQEGLRPPWPKALDDPLGDSGQRNLEVGSVELDVVGQVAAHGDRFRFVGLHQTRRFRVDPGDVGRRDNRQAGELVPCRCASAGVDGAGAGELVDFQVEVHIDRVGGDEGDGASGADVQNVIAVDGGAHVDALDAHGKAVVGNGGEVAVGVDGGDSGLSRGAAGPGGDQEESGAHVTQDHGELGAVRDSRSDLGFDVGGETGGDPLVVDGGGGAGGEAQRAAGEGVDFGGEVYVDAAP